MTSTALPQPRTGIAAAIVDRLGIFRSRPRLPRLADTRPDATGSPRRSRGLATIPVSAIVGTAAMAPGTRQHDFLPSAGHAPAGWQLRWERLNEAGRNQIHLPPIDVLKADDGYWVLDGHNRVALAKATGQEWIDAEVTELFLPSAHTSTTPHSLTLKEA